jgi:hypothetical protein
MSLAPQVIVWVYETIWIHEENDVFTAIDSMGTEIARHIHRSSLDYIIRDKMYRREIGATSICHVRVKRQQRGPNKPRRNR